MPTKPQVRPSKPSPHPVRDAADALYRASAESCHQHQRLTKVLSHQLDDMELEGVVEVVELCDGLLAKATTRYEEASKEGRGKEDEDLWKAANALWMAAREYCRRHEQSDAIGSRFRKHGAAEFNEISMEYELEMSARLALKQALQVYAKQRPEAAA